MFWKLIERYLKTGILQLYKLRASYMVYVHQHKRQERDVSPGSKRYGTKLQQDFNDYVFLQTYTPFFFNKKDFF